MKGSLRERFARWRIAAACVLAANAVYLAIADHAPIAPRSELAAFTYLANVLLHIGLGVLATIPLLLAARAAGRRLGSVPGVEKVVYWVMALLLLGCLGTGWYLLV